jgi:hypothetical protein
MSKPVVEVKVLALGATNGGCAVFLGNEDKVFVMFVDQSVGTAITMFQARHAEGTATLGRDRLHPVLGPARTNHQPTGKAQKPSLPHGIALGTRQYERLGFDYYCGLLPSVAQPPFPLHEL